MCFIEVDDLALNGQVMPVIQTKISFNIIGNKQAAEGRKLADQLVKLIIIRRGENQS